MKHVFIAVPAFGGIIQSTTVSTIVALTQTLSTKGIAAGFATLSYPDIAELRNMFLSIFYDGIPAATHLLFIDADMGFAPDLVLDMLQLDEPVIGSLYPQKTLPIRFAGSGTGEKMAAVRGYFMEVGGFGFGCALIRRDAVTTMLEKMPQINDTNIEMHNAKDLLISSGAKRVIRAFDPIYGPLGKVSEDLSFCQRWRDCGGTAWAAIGHSITHMGMYGFTGKYLDVMNNPDAQPVAVLQPSPALATMTADAAKTLIDQAIGETKQAAE